MRSGRTGGQPDFPCLQATSHLFDDFPRRIHPRQFDAPKCQSLTCPNRMDRLTFLFPMVHFRQGLLPFISGSTALGQPRGSGASRWFRPDQRPLHSTFRRLWALKSGCLKASESNWSRWEVRNPWLKSTSCTPRAMGRGASPYEALKALFPA